MQPMDYEQTLRKAFTVAGIGLHSGEFGKYPAAVYLIHVKPRQTQASVP